MNGQANMLRLALSSPSFAAPVTRKPPMPKPIGFLGPPVRHRPGGFPTPVSPLAQALAALGPVY